MELSKTEEQLKDLNINYSMLLMEIPEGKKILINHKINKEKNHLKRLCYQVLL